MICVVCDKVGAVRLSTGLTVHPDCFWGGLRDHHIDSTFSGHHHRHPTANLEGIHST